MSEVEPESQFEDMKIETTKDYLGNLQYFGILGMVLAMTFMLGVKSIKKCQKKKIDDDFVR